MLHFQEIYQKRRKRQCAPAGSSPWTGHIPGQDFFSGGLSIGWHVQIHRPSLQITDVINSFRFAGRPVRKLVRKGTVNVSVVGKIMSPKGACILPGNLSPYVTKGMLQL